jgi:hypothetical protein
MAPPVWRSSLVVGALLGGRRPQPWVNLGSHVRPDRVQRYPVAGVLKGDDGCSDSFGERMNAFKWHQWVGSDSEYQRWGVNMAGVYLTEPSRRF